ncbi:unnamed protein product [Didymodactylos carnosus]|uniref:Phospholipase A2 n=1 Tax=Didymodactylos carnosus TaxID=1234261 RepID=A0A8S2P137_9BILA|nr:unnamed protein product [Didymodactylos carnosus]CAF4027151.1 unnamed protein product [Didymodactylos carnosus]
MLIPTSIFLAVLTFVYGQTRNAAQFGMMIQFQGLNAMEYEGYGCWCGYGTKGDMTVDATDRCCQVHDRCYDEAQLTHNDCLLGKATLTTYDATDYAGDIKCTDERNTCDYAVCMCDREAVKCYKKHVATFDLDFDNWEGVCDPSDTTTEKCFDAWDKSKVYVNGMDVSRHGINYRANHWSLGSPPELNHNFGKDLSREFAKGSKCRPAS